MSLEGHDSSAHTHALGGAAWKNLLPQRHEACPPLEDAEKRCLAPRAA